MWDGILSISCLKDLALDSTLNRYILSALQTTDADEDNLHKCQKVGNTLQTWALKLLQAAPRGDGETPVVTAVSHTFSRWWSACQHSGSRG